MRSKDWQGRARSAQVRCKCGEVVAELPAGAQPRAGQRCKRIPCAGCGAAVPVPVEVCGE
jgi:hypothetical protein